MKLDIGMFQKLYKLESCISCNVLYWPVFQVKYACTTIWVLNCIRHALEMTSISQVTIVTHASRADFSRSQKDS